MISKESYDVIIVGGGPAGAGAARALTGSGLNTLIVERHKLPRYKMCSGIVFPSSRKVISDNFGEIPDAVLCSPKRVKGNRIVATLDDQPIDVPFSIFDEGEELEEEGLNAWRSELDSWLCSCSDAEIVGDCVFTDFVEDGNEYIVNLKCAGEKVSLRAKYLIGADGTRSKVRNTAYPGFEDNVGLVPNYEEIYKGKIDLEPGWLYLFMDRSITGYFATVFHKDDEIIVVTGVQQRESVRKYFEVFKSHLQEVHGLVVDEKVTTNGCVLTDMSAQKNYCLGKDNLLLVGEAGGFLRGGEGITSSLVSGKVAGEAVLESTTSGNPAIDHFKELSAEEISACEKVHERLAGALGFNVFMRE